MLRRTHSLRADDLNKTDTGMKKLLSFTNLPFLWDFSSLQGRSNILYYQFAGHRVTDLTLGRDGEYDRHTEPV